MNVKEQIQSNRIWSVYKLSFASFHLLWTFSIFRNFAILLTRCCSDLRFCCSHIAWQVFSWRGSRVLIGIQFSMRQSSITFLVSFVSVCGEMIFPLLYNRTCIFSLLQSVFLHISGFLYFSLRLVEREPAVPTAGPRPQRCGGEIKMATLSVTPVGSITSYTTWVTFYFIYQHFFFPS